MITKKFVKKILDIEEWVNQDADKILTIFAKNATYHERVLGKPFKGHKQIRKYWQSKVVKEQSNIKFKLLDLFIDGNIAIAEWDASFNSNIEKARIHIREVAIIEFHNNKVSSLREYWHSERKIESLSFKI